MSSWAATCSAMLAPGLGKVLHEIPKLLDRSIAGEIYGERPSVDIRPPLIRKVSSYSLRLFLAGRDRL